MEKILKAYLRRLTNLSGNNRSLLLLRLISDQFLDLHDLDYELNQPSFHIIQRLINRSAKIQLCEAMDPRSASTNRLSEQLKKIDRIDRFIFEERGAKDLYVGWPFVRGKMADGTLVRCPLAFFPVELRLSQGKWELLRRRDVTSTLNKTFLLAYAHFNQRQVDETLLDTVLDEFDRDANNFRRELYHLLEESEVAINFNRDTYTDQLVPFKHFKKAAFKEVTKRGELKLYQEAVLGIFPQAGSFLVPDYLHMIDTFGNQPFENLFSAHFQELINKERILTEESIFTPYRMDAYQERALTRVKKGESLVIQGPPGSGKSQLICNLISDFIARGKNVLLVCQKRAALDVVFERLVDKQLHQFIGLVHDFKNDRKSIYGQIAAQIDTLQEYKDQNNSLDAIFLERKFQQTSRTIDALSEELQEFKAALYDDSECGKSVKELYLLSSPYKSSVSLNQEYRKFHYSSIETFQRQLNRYLDYFEMFNGHARFWAEGVSFAEFSTTDFKKLQELVMEIPAFNHWLDKKARAFTRQKMDYDSIKYFVEKKEALDQLRSLVVNETIFSTYCRIIAEEPHNPEVIVQRLEQGIMGCFKGAGPEQSLTFDQLGRFQEALEHAMQARSGIFSWIRWRMTSKDKLFISRVLVANDLKSDKDGFEILLEKIDNRLNFEHFIQEIKTSTWLPDFPGNLRKIDAQSWFVNAKESVRAFQLRKEIRSLVDFIPAVKTPHERYVSRLEALSKTLEEVPTQINFWRAYLSEFQIRTIAAERITPADAIHQLKRDFDGLVEYHQLRDSFEPHERAAADKITEEYQDKSQALATFDNSLALAWIDHVEAKFPVLRGVSSQKINHLTNELQAALVEKREVSKEIVLLKTRERTYAGVEYNRLNNRVTYRDLYHQVTKKRRIWPIRKVVSNFDEELFNLLPCWLASPESASAIFPMAQLFDLVIFDEASQCFAERGLPAMSRGTQVVVAGDKKQLKPNDLYRVRWEDEADEQMEMEVDSLLDLAGKFLAEEQLSGHYRSASLQLIDFSNQVFYDGRLKMLPHFEVVNQKAPFIEYHKVKGIWDAHSNRPEAEKVVELVKDITENSNLSVGVVTFNATQQVLILDLLEQAAETNDFQLPSSLFIKNIENVQGDERDVIIFSTAYGPDKKGKLRMHFGTLNQDGGENRLNVAVTRARVKIHLVTSVTPSDIRTADSKNAGPKLLKKYLQYALDISQGHWSPTLEVPSEFSPKWYLRDQLKQMSNHELKLDRTQPFADLDVQIGDTYLGLILTDDDLYYQAVSVKEAHAYQPFLFNEKKWPFIRFYSREIWMDREIVGDKLDKFLDRVR